MALLQTLLTTLFPDQCVLCSDLTSAPHGLCGSCWKDTPFLLGHKCALCAVPLPGHGDGTDDLCDACLRAGRPWNRGHAVLAYNGLARALVHRLKYSDRTDLAVPASAWMAAHIGPFVPRGALVVPVPAHPLRLLRRRYNQAALLARGYAERTGAELQVDALIRRRATTRLDDMTATQRFACLEGAIVPHPRRGGSLSGRSVLLIDDVMTSGATLGAAARAARKAGAARVEVAVLARTLKEP